MIASINPATGETLRTFAPLSDRDLDDRLSRAEAPTNLPQYVLCRP